MAQYKDVSPQNSTEDVPHYSGKPLDYDLNPVVLSKKDQSQIEQALTKLLKEVESFTSSISKDRKILAQLGLPEDLDLTPTPLGLHIPFARFDFLYNKGEIHVLELNTDGTSGWNVVEWLGTKSNLKSDENPNYELSRRLLSAIREHDNKASEIVLMDFKGQATSWEQNDLIAKWNKITPTKLCDPGMRNWKNGALCYRRALSWQLRSQKIQAAPFLSDWSENKIKVVGGWSSDVGMSKAWPHFVKSKALPETLLINAKTVTRLKDEKDQWILKGALSFSGKSLVSGVKISQEKWEKSLSMTLSETTQGRSWIAQKRCDVPKYEGGPVEYGLYMLNGKPSGYLCRWGSDEPVSDTSKEILRPVVIK